MRYLSSRNAHNRVPLSKALRLGLASDGGLFVPEKIPKMAVSPLWAELSYPECAAQLLSPFFAEDTLASLVPEMCQKAFSFPLPLKNLSNGYTVLELFHGPTASFKDFGARFLAQCLSRANDRSQIILTATSGDTGSAVASAFYQQKNTKAIILYPENKISAIQEQQMTCWGDNVIALAIQGTFDDCQRLVKAAFATPSWQALGDLNSANSINIGRLLAQMTYYAYVSVQKYQEAGRSSDFIIPSGNLGNACAAYWAKKMGFPIGKLVLSTNANTVLKDYLASSIFKKKASIQTLASAMDVGNPSNLERLQTLFGSFKRLKEHMQVVSVNDTAIKECMRMVYAAYHYLICPHTATAFEAALQCPGQEWVLVSTADPAKFKETIAPLLQVDIPLSLALKALAEKSSSRHVLTADLKHIRDYLKGIAFI